MKYRIKEIRKDNGLSQEQFAEKLNIGQTTVAGYESGTRTPRNSTIKAICNTFNISEEWLLSGKGIKKKALNREQEIAEITAKLFKEDDESIRLRFVQIVCNMTEEQLQMWHDTAEQIVKKPEK